MTFESLSIEQQTWIAILIMGAITYASRLSGYFLFATYKPSGRVKLALDAMPTAILAAVIAPNVFLSGPAEWAGGAVALATALLRAPLLVTIAAGMAAVALMRMAF
jgi:uncharacterized membrane protein